MITVTKKRDDSIVFGLPLSKKMYINSGLDYYETELFYPGTIIIKIDGVDIDKSKVKFQLTNKSTSKIYDTMFGEQELKDMPIGEYYLECFGINNYVTPVLDTQILNESGSIVFACSYNKNINDIEIQIESNDPTFDKNIVSWEILSDLGFYEKGEGVYTFKNMPMGNYTVNFGLYSTDYSAPEPQTKAMEYNKNLVFDGVYNGKYVEADILPNNVAYDSNIEFMFRTTKQEIDISGLKGLLISKNTGCQKYFKGQVYPSDISNSDTGLLPFPSGKVNLKFLNFLLSQYKYNLAINHVAYGSDTNNYIDLSDLTLPKSTDSTKADLTITIEILGYANG